MANGRQHFMFGVFGAAAASLPDLLDRRRQSRLLAGSIPGNPSASIGLSIWSTT